MVTNKLYLDDRTDEYIFLCKFGSHTISICHFRHNKHPAATSQSHIPCHGIMLLTCVQSRNNFLKLFMTDLQRWSVINTNRNLGTGVFETGKVTGRQMQLRLVLFDVNQSVGKPVGGLAF